MEKVRKVQTVLAKTSLALAAILMATVALSIFVNVAARYIFKVGLMWVEQYARYSLIWSVFLSANVLIYDNALMRVDFMDVFWPSWIKTGREKIYALLFVLILGIVTWQGWLQARAYIGVSLMGIALDKFWVYLCVPVGTGLMLVQYFLNALIAFWKCNEIKGEEGGAR